MKVRKSLCLIGAAAVLSLCACSGSGDDSQEFVSHGENITNGNTSLIVDSSEGERAELTMPPEASRVTLTVGLVKNDVGAVTLASLAQENQNNESFEKYNFVYAENYTALSQMLKDGTVGAAVMPPAEALDIYAADKSVKVIASLTGKSFKLVGENISSLTDLSGRTIYVSEDDKTAGCLIKKLTAYAGVNDYTISYARDNNELYTMAGNGTTDVALLPQTYISMLKENGAAIHEYDFSQDWENATEGNSYSTSCVVATNDFLETQKAVVDYMLADMERSVDAINSDTEGSANAAVTFGMADNSAAAADAYSGIDCGFYSGKQMRYLINNMFTIIDNADGEALGTEVPGEDFYLVKDE